MGASAESAASEEGKDGLSSGADKVHGNNFGVDVVSDMVCKDQKKGEDHEEYENLSEAFNMKHNCIDGSCQLTCQVFPLL